MLSEVRFFGKNGYMPYPKIIQIEITNRCPLNCKQCYKDINAKDMDYEKLKKIIIDAVNLGIKCIMINGGEPLVYYKFKELIKFIDSLGLSVYCFTSGFGLDEDMINELKNTNLNISLSLNGSNENVNSISRDGFNYTIKAMELLKNNNLNFGINWVARNDNVKDLPNIIRICKENNGKWINIIGNKITCNGTLQSPLTRNDYSFLKKIIDKYNNENLIRIENCNSLLIAYLNMPINKRFNGCTAGINVCAIDINGNYMPCSHLNYKEKFNSLEEYWINSIVLKNLRKVKCKNLTYCRDCKNNNNCKPCRGLSLKMHNDVSCGFKECPIYVKN